MLKRRAAVGFSPRRLDDPIGDRERSSTKVRTAAGQSESNHATEGVVRVWIDRDERVVVFNTGAAQKYPEAMAVHLPEIDKDAKLDWERIARG